MTLIAGFRCEEEAITACADSQETVTMPSGDEYRVTRQKIKPKKCGNFELALAGTSPNAPLLDACVSRIQKNTARFSGKSLSELEGFLSNELLDFGRKDSKLYGKKERTVTLLIVARSIYEPGVECWHTAATQLIPIERTKLVGWNEALYEHVLERLYPESGPLLPPQQAILLGMHIMELAEKTSNYVRGPVTVIVAKPGAIWVLDKTKVARFKEQMSVFGSQIDSLLLSFADYTISRPQYEAKLDEFKATLLQIREDYIQEAVPKTIEEIMTTNYPVRSVPSGSVMRTRGDGKIEFSEDPRDLKRIKDLIDSVSKVDRPFYFRCTNCNLELEYKATTLFMEQGEQVESVPNDVELPGMSGRQSSRQKARPV